MHSLKESHLNITNALLRLRMTVLYSEILLRMKMELSLTQKELIHFTTQTVLSSLSVRDLRTVLSTQQQVLRLLQGDFLTQTRLVTQAVRVYLHQVMLSTVQEPQQKLLHTARLWQNQCTSICSRCQRMKNKFIIPYIFL